MNGVVSRASSDDSEPEAAELPFDIKFNDNDEHETEVARLIIRDARKGYNWWKFVPSSLNPKVLCTWLMTGFSSQTELPDEVVERNTTKLARMLMLLREYEENYGIPEIGGTREQLWVLTELCTRLYGSGTPLWVLKPVMSKAAEGVTGNRGVDFVFFTRNAFIYSPANVTTASFPMVRGFDMRMVTLTERILVRLASFTANTRAVHSIKSKSPRISDLVKAARGQSVLSLGQSSRSRNRRCASVAKEILDLASEGTGFFYLINEELNGGDDGIVSDNSDVSVQTRSEIEAFWTVEPSTRDLFTRLVTIEAIASLLALKKMPTSDKYPRAVILLFRVISSAGAAALWFGASWWDMLIAGCLAVVVALFQGSNIWKHERMIFEVIVSFFVGFVAGMVSITWQSHSCFQAIAVAAVIDILQGFRLVYSIMEVCNMMNTSLIFCIVLYLA